MTTTLPIEAIETASRDELAALQLERLKWSLNHAYENSPVYRRKFDEAGVHPSQVQSLSDLARFPFTTKKDLRDNYPFGMFAVPMEQVSRIHASSGTTGKPTVVGYTARDIDTWANLVARSVRASGARRGDKVHVSYGYGLFTGGLGAHYGAERAGLTVIPFGGGQTEKQVQLIQDFRPDIIMVTPSYMLAIADEMERQGIDPASTYYNGTSPITLTIPGGGTWNVHNAEAGGGVMSLEDATWASVNVIFAQLDLDVGPENVTETAEEMGIESPLESVPAEAIGGLAIGVTPLEITD